MTARASIDAGYVDGGGGFVPPPTSLASTPQKGPRRDSNQRSISPEKPQSRRESETSIHTNNAGYVPTFSPTSIAPPPTLSVAPPLPPVPTNTPTTPPTSTTTAPNYFADIKKPEQNHLAHPPPSHASKGRVDVMKNNQTSPTKDDSKQKGDSKTEDKKSKSSIFGSILGKIGILPPNQVHLPDDNDATIVWDDTKKKWVDKNAPEEEDSIANSAPPSDMELSRNNSTANFDAAPAPPPSMGGNLAPPPPALGGNKFSGGLSKKRGALGRVDVFKNSQSSPSLSSSNSLPPPNELFMPPPVAPASTPIDAPIEEASAATESLGAETTAPVTTPLGGGGLTFFNPNSFTGAAPSTRRNKY